MYTIAKIEYIRDLDLARVTFSENGIQHLESQAIEIDPKVAIDKKAGIVFTIQSWRGDLGENPKYKIYRRVAVPAENLLELQ